MRRGSTLTRRSGCARKGRQAVSFFAVCLHSCPLNYHLAGGVSDVAERSGDPKHSAVNRKARKSQNSQKVGTTRNNSTTQAAFKKILRSQKLRYDDFFSECSKGTGIYIRNNIRCFSSFTSTRRASGETCCGTSPEDLRLGSASIFAIVKLLDKFRIKYFQCISLFLIGFLNLH